jgi:hypothetical protein
LDTWRSASRRAPRSASLLAERQSLLIEALIRMIVEKGICTAEALNDLARAIDEEDGVVDGRRSTDMMVARGVVTCPHCQRKTSAKNPLCQWCATELPFQYV